jgi:predicted NAD-dependent protein-ADP-ribosyltransferase YbiA (DUF1768 family)
MMYHKAMTFSDTDTAKEILLTSSARKCKRMGRRIDGFKDEIWDLIKQSVVEEGSVLELLMRLERKRRS